MVDRSLLPPRVRLGLLGEPVTLGLDDTRLAERVTGETYRRPRISSLNPKSFLSYSHDASQFSRL